MVADLKDMVIKEVAILHEDDPANEGALVKLKKRLDPKGALDAARARFDKRLAKAEREFKEACDAVVSGRPVEKRRKRRRPMVVEETRHEEADDGQPPRIGPSAHASPDQYPVGKRSPAAEARETRLQKAADRYCSQVLAVGSTPGDQFAESRAIFKSYRDGLFNGSVRATEYQPIVGADPRYDRLMKRAAKIAKRTGDTVEREFAKLYESPVEVLKRAKPPANSSLTDDDDVEARVGDGEMDDDDEADDTDLRGDRGEPAGTASGGRSVGDYEHSGANTMVNSGGAAGGPLPRSYDPRRRPRSARRGM